MARSPRLPTFDEVLANAVNDFTTNGYDSAERLVYWQNQLRQAAQTAARPSVDVAEELRRALSEEYERQISGKLIERHTGVSKFTVDRLRPSMRAELDRRIMASADLIRVNRSKAIEQTLQRFAGWSTSIPPGGSKTVDKRDVRSEVRKPLASLPYEQRRLYTDQGHKLVSNISEVVATGGGAIAGVWHSHYRQAGYDYREDHKERDEVVFLIRGSWADEKGFVKPGPAGYSDKITRPGEEPFCRCYYTWLYHLRALPESMITLRGKKALEEARAKIGVAA